MNVQSQFEESQGRLFEDRILAIDLPVPRLAGEMAEMATAKGQAPDLADVIIAATAKHHDLILVAQTFKHFTILAIECQSPPQ